MGMPEPELSEQEIEIIAWAEALFESMCEKRHQMGNQKYGKLTFLEMPTLEMALEELADLANYARYTFVKVALLRQAIMKFQGKAVVSVDGFHSMSEVLGLKKKGEQL